MTVRAKVAKFCPYIVLGAVFCLLLLLNLVCHDHWLDSDMAAEMIFSKLLAGEGHLFAAKDWYYSTEFRFLYTHWIMGPLFHVLRDWHVIRAVTNILSYVLVLASYYYFMKPFKVSRGLVVMTSAILLLPFSETMMTHMVMGNTYMFHVIIVFLFFGLYLRLAGVSGTWRERGKSVNGRTAAVRIFRTVCYLALALICGVSGVRYLLALQCPLVLTAFLYLLHTPEFQQFRKSMSADKLTRDLEPVWKTPAMKYFWLSLLGLMVSVMGYGVNVVYVSRNYVFQTYDATNFISIYRGELYERVQNAIGCLLMLFGYIPDRGVLSLRGLVTVLAFVMLFVFGYCAVKGYRKNCGQRRFVSLFLLVSFCLNMFVFCFTTSTMVPRYYITTFIFALPVLCFYLEKEEVYFDRLAVCLILAASLSIATGKTVLSYLSVDKNAPKRIVAEFLQENDLHFGYATYWNANIMTELTDGAVEVANVGNPEELEFFKWSSPMKYYEDGYHDGTVFLLLTAEEATDYADAPAVAQGEVIFRDDAYTVFLFESSEALMKLARENGGTP